MRIFCVPIEPLEERYSEQWLRWYPKALAECGADVRVIEGDSLTDKIETGSWLDIHSTIHYKSTQVAKIVKMIKDGEIVSGDTLFFFDLWFPGIEGIRYVADLCKLDIKIVGYVHAGAWDPADLLAREIQAPWIVDFENALLNCADLIFITSAFHQSLLLSRRFNFEKIRLIPCGFNFSEYDSFLSNEKYDVCVFPHRLDPEKRPDMFDRLEEACKGSGVEFISSKIHCNNKDEYLSLLGSSKCAVSFARQETFGIAMVEAAYMGCKIICPRGLSYPEIVPFACFYNNDMSDEKTVKEVAELVQEACTLEYDSDYVRSMLKNRYSINEVARDIYDAIAEISG